MKAEERQKQLELEEEERAQKRIQAELEWEQEQKKRREEFNKQNNGANPVQSTLTNPETDAQDSNFHRFQVVLRGWSLNDNDKKDSHFEFSFEVREFFDPSNYLEWVIEKRFSEFRQLHEQLKGMFSRSMIPDLPSSSVLKNQKNSAFLSQRAKGLEAYLVKVASTNIFQVDCLHNFLGLSNPNRNITMGSSMSQTTQSMEPLDNAITT